VAGAVPRPGQISLKPSLSWGASNGRNMDPTSRPARRSPEANGAQGLQAAKGGPQLLGGSDMGRSFHWPHRLVLRSRPRPDSPLHHGLSCGPWHRGDGEIPESAMGRR